MNVFLIFPILSSITTQVVILIYTFFYRISYLPEVDLMRLKILQYRCSLFIDRKKKKRLDEDETKPAVNQFLIQNA